ncbi:MAG: hypothetical protein IIX61_06430 [Loktanella sp.]|nr:hypothetical protein [Loktanella sp.]
MQVVQFLVDKVAGRRCAVWRRKARLPDRESPRKVTLRKRHDSMSGKMILPDPMPDMRNITAADRGFGLNAPYFKTTHPAVCSATSGDYFS